MSLRKEAEVTTLNFGDDWIKVRSKRLYGDTETAQRAAASQTTVKVGGKKEKGEEEETPIEFDITKFNMSLLTSMIVEWSDPEEITAENIRVLPSDVITEVLGVISEGLDEEEKAPLEKTSSSPSEPPEESFS